MDPDNNVKPAPRKVRFAPKAPPQRRAKLLPKVEKVEEEYDAQAQEMFRQFTEADMKGKPKVERKVAPVQVAFGHVASEAQTKQYGGRRGGGIHYGGASDTKAEKQYREPWDYSTNYPITLPLRRPESGNPEHLDAKEFGMARESLTHEEPSTNTGFDLGLMEENIGEESLLFMQLPTYMPKVRDKSSKACTWDEFATGTEGNGFMGKMYVYKSGAVKMKLGDTLYNVSSGMDSVFAQEVVAMNTEAKHCCSLGELNKRVIVTPDFDSLDSISDL